MSPLLSAADVARGTRRMLWHQGWRAIPEMTLPDGHRADLLALGPGGQLLIVEIKVSAADLRGDGKWQAYGNHADRFAWAVPPMLAPLLDEARFQPDVCGLIVADRHEAVWQREPRPAAPLHPSRRRALLLAFARCAASRLHQLHDPDFDGWTDGLAVPGGRLSPGPAGR